MLSSGNNLLGVLGQRDFEALKPFLKTVHAAKGTVLYDQGDKVCSMYFPCGGSIVALEILVTEGKAVEANLIGREGVIGAILGAGYMHAYARARVQFPGEFLKIDKSDLEKVKAHFPPVAHLLACYSECLFNQLLQSIACNATHSIEQRTAKWLSFTVDRTGTVEITLTQEEFANIIGVSRTYMSRVLQGLRNLRILETRRGSILVCDRTMLQKLTCGCYDAVCHHFETVLKGVYPGRNRFPESSLS